MRVTVWCICLLSCILGTGYAVYGFHCASNGAYHPTIGVLGLAMLMLGVLGLIASSR